jgi:BirA family biotin operon repressor/biotin-[acetyl-CoA-carboxylase] ligase
MKHPAIRNPWPEAPVRFNRRTTSTMEDARRLFISGCPEGTVILTDFQTAGRGRIAERRWIAEAGKNLLFTVVLRRQGGTGGIAAAPQRLPLIAGLALALSVEHLYGLSVQLKWPNDLLFREKKLAGILCEALVEGKSVGLLVGIGVNCNQVTFPRELESKATSLARVLGRRINRFDLLQDVLGKLKTGLEDKDWHAKVVERLYGLRRTNEASHTVLLSVAAGAASSRQGSEMRGVILGLNPDGSLLFQPENADPVSVYSGEIRFVVAGAETE